ncbi:MAG: hypothetical protein RXS23_02680 [Metallosphaera yellowstonensis]|jgi:hypothetical protein|uniref:Sugar kinase, ribokinase n=1 Tax=Metallosphaera yellowstonensis MK1 TaxID=671065 RepID=H2C609_9CREN|nr:hypothetical protein [Metallosphaera yellowstonensis]EHP69236.1 hypothetical protein MetMK1DRAFT_00019830 [Metallosphaera yellowstonensis MK1]
MKTRVAIIGAFTIDEIVNGQGLVERPGGAPVYAGMGVVSSEGEAGAYTAWGEDFHFSRPSYLTIIRQFLFNKTIRFRIGFEGDKRVLVLRAIHDRMPVDIGILRGWEGLILNPVCNELSWGDLEIDKPVGVDIQGFIRVCEVDKPITYTHLRRVKVSSPLTVFHANAEELSLADLSVEDIHEMGFKEVLVSDGQNGFVLHVKEGPKEKFAPQRVGNYEIGNGDYLLSTYFTHRVKGLDELASARIASILTQEFSISGPTLPLPQG